MIDKPCTYVPYDGSDDRTRGFIRSVGWTSAGASLVIEIEGGKLAEVPARLVTVTPDLTSWNRAIDLKNAFDEIRHVSGLLLELTPASMMADLSALASILQKRLEDARMLLWPTDSRVGP